METMMTRMNLGQAPYMLMRVAAHKHLHQQRKLVEPTVYHDATIPDKDSSTALFDRSGLFCHHDNFVCEQEVCYGVECAGGLLENCFLPCERGFNLFDANIGFVDPIPCEGECTDDGSFCTHKGTTTGYVQVDPDPACNCGCEYMNELLVTEIRTSGTAGSNYTLVEYAYFQDFDFRNCTLSVDGVECNSCAMDGDDLVYNCTNIPDVDELVVLGDTALNQTHPLYALTSEGTLFCDPEPDDCGCPFFRSEFLAAMTNGVS